jgi:hypothetical protein
MHQKGESRRSGILTEAWIMIAVEQDRGVFGSFSLFLGSFSGYDHACLLAFWYKRGMEIYCDLDRHLT